MASCINSSSITIFVRMSPSGAEADVYRMGLLCVSVKLGQCCAARMGFIAHTGRKLCSWKRILTRFVGRIILYPIRDRPAHYPQEADMPAYVSLFNFT